LKEKESLSYLSDRGFSISAAELYRLKNEVKDNTQQRLNKLPQEFLSQHLERIETLKTIHNELWNVYHIETNPTKKANILMQLAELQQYLSSYHDSTRYVLEQAAKTQHKSIVSK
jgi:hypothetical protein